MLSNVNNTNVDRIDKEYLKLHGYLCTEIYGSDVASIMRDVTYCHKNGVKDGSPKMI